MERARTYFQTLPAVAFFCLLCASDGARPAARGAVGGLAELRCGSPPPDDTNVSAVLHVVEWVRQGIDIPVLIKFGAYAPRLHPGYEGRVSLVRATDLRVEPLVLEDQGRYQCHVLLLDNKADDHDVRDDTWTLLSVTAPPIFTKTPPPVLEALVGHQLSLACAANGNPTPTITWLKDGSPMRGEDVEIRDGVLSLRAVSIHSGGQYTCLASSSEGNASHLTALKVKGPPVIVIPPKSTSLNMSQNALLQCQAVADPPNMTYVWQKGSENVYHIEALKSRVKIMVDGTLLISNLIPEDSGNYTCIPTNGILTPPTASAILTVMHPARTLHMPKNTYIPTGMEGLVTCPTMAQPPLVHVDWTKDGEPLDLALYPGWSLTSEGSVFMATVNDDAAGVYTCTPYNSYGTMGPSETTTVILQDPPSFSVAPQKQYKQEAGETLLIPCQGNGNPATSVTWSKVGLASRATYSVATNGSLLLAPVSKDHQGAWECTAANHVASVKTDTVVLVLGTSPHAATSLTVSPGVRQANISWEAGFDGGSVQTFSVWVKQMSGKDGEKRRRDWFSVPVLSSAGTRFQVTGLAPSTEYQFSVLSQNKAGTGPFSEIITTRTSDPPSRRGPKPPASLSAHQAPKGVVLQWARPAPLDGPITGFALQGRTGQGDWVGLDEDIGGNASEIIVPGLRKDCVYELRMLSRRGDLLSEPSPSVNVSTMGMEIYPASSQLTETVQAPLLAGVMGGVGFMCLALVLLLGSACFISHRRNRRRRRGTDEPPLAIYKSPPSARASGAGSPDSVLKKSLLHSRSLFTTTTSSSSSTLKSDCSLYIQEPLSSSRDPHHHHHHHHQFPSRGLLSGAVSSPISPQLELICRGPDGRFHDRPYDQTSTLSVHDKRGRPAPPPAVQRSASLRSRRGDEEREPPFVLCVDLPPCFRPPPPPRRYEEGDYDVASELSDSSRSDDGGGGVPGAPARPVTTASTLVLQMEHERERGNLSRCLKLAQEREELERELRRFTLDRTAEREGWRPGTEAEDADDIVADDDSAAGDSNDDDSDDDGSGWISKSATYSHAPLQAASRREAAPLTSATSQILERRPCGVSPAVSSSCFGPSAQLPGPPLVRQTPLPGDAATDRASGDRFVLPHLSSRHQTLERAEEQSVVVEMHRNDLRRQRSRSPSRHSAPASQTNKFTKTPTSVHSEDTCIEMSVDEPDLSVTSPLAKPMLHHRIASHLQEGFSLAPKGLSQDDSNARFSCQNHRPREASERALENTPGSSGRAPNPWKAKNQGSRTWNYYHRSRSLDSRGKTHSNFLTPDAWIDSLSQENCSTPLSFRPDSKLCRPQSTPSLEATRRLPSLAHPAPPAPLHQPPSAPHQPHATEPLCPQAPQNRDPSAGKSLFPGEPKQCHNTAKEEVQGPVENREATVDASGSALPINVGTGPREEPGPPERDLGPSWSSTDGPPWTSARPEVQPARKAEPCEAVDMGRGYGGSGGSGGSGESGGSYSSYASSGRGSLEPANRRLSLCLSPTLNSSPETVEGSQTLTEKTDLHQMTLRKRRKASVDENYEWDTTDIRLLPGDQDGGLLPLLDLQRPSPSLGLLDMQHSNKALKDYSQLSLLQADGHSSFCSEPPTETVLF